ncbi:hypothetical protein YC2023_076972 [Brassica napus]|uniref:Uncharacterized protein n=2 Tax=Brassica TaxID=3705 RepID=A0A3P6GTM6_BRAOL|nr:unnamed protein product [Brassica napus]VDD61434.1 unnamed protein product [Brassica oleracea]
MYILYVIIEKSKFKMVKYQFSLDESLAFYSWKLKNIDKTDINKHIRRVLTKLQTHTQIQRRA